MERNLIKVIHMLAGLKNYVIRLGNSRSQPCIYFTASVLDSENLTFQFSEFQTSRYLKYFLTFYHWMKQFLVFYRTWEVFSRLIVASCDFPVWNFRKTTTRGLRAKFSGISGNSHNFSGHCDSSSIYFEGDSFFCFQNRKILVFSRKNCDKTYACGMHRYVNSFWRL